MVAETELGVTTHEAESFGPHNQSFCNAGDVTQGDGVRAGPADCLIRCFVLGSDRSERPIHYPRIWPEIALMFMFSVECRGSRS